MTLKRKTHYDLAVNTLKMVCDFYDTDYNLVLTRKRTYQTSKCRHVYYWLMKKHTGLSLAQIGSYIGSGYNHATVLHGVKRVEDMMSTEIIERNNIRELDRMFKERQMFTGDETGMDVLLIKANRLISKHSEGNQDLQLAQSIIYKIMQEEGALF